MTTTGRRYLAGVQGSAWHAIDTAGMELNCGLHSWAICGAVCRKADGDQPFDPGAYPVSFGPCPECRWLHAMATGTLGVALESLRHPLARDAAAAVLNLAVRDLCENERLDDPAVPPLLAHISRHDPAPLVAEECAEGCCDHLDEETCPESLACAACSLQTGSWAGEWEGTYRHECQIEGPCAVLLMIAETAQAELAKAAA